jgi:hypothetical protein
MVRSGGNISQELQSITTAICGSKMIHISKIKRFVWILLIFGTSVIINDKPLFFLIRKYLLNVYSFYERKHLNYSNGFCIKKAGSSGRANGEIPRNGKQDLRNDFIALSRTFLVSPA